MKRIVHWLPAAGVAVLIGAGVAAVPALAGAGSDLPDATAQEVLELVAGSKGTAFSGTVEQSSDLGLPDLPTAGLNGPRSSSDDSTALVELLTADHRLRVYTDGGTGQRVQILDEMAERNVVRNGADVWLYDSDEDEVTHLTLPEHDSSMPAEHTPPTPPELAEQLLADLDRSTEVTVENDGRVAGRDAYELVLTPRTDATLVGDVTISVDAETGLPLKVAVDPRGSEQDAFTVAFTSVDVSAPPADLFQFAPPEGATVEEETLPSGGGAMPGHVHAPLITGADWSTVVEVPADVLTSADRDQQALITQLTTAVPEGRAFQTRILTILLTDDGRALAGAVPLEALQAAAR